MSIDNLKEQVLMVSKKAYDNKLFAGTSGNLSAIDRENGLIAITPTSVPYPTMTLEDIVVIDILGRVKDGRHKPSSEWQLHTEIYKNLTSVCSVAHTHSPNATAFAAAHKAIPVILIEMMYFLLGDVPLSEYAAPGSAEVGKNAIKQLEHRGACLLANHGVVTIGDNLDQAYIRAVYTEDAADIYIKSSILGIPEEITVAEQNKIRIKMGLAPE